MNGENGVRARRVFVHVGFADLAVLSAGGHRALDVLSALYDHVGESLDVDALLRVLLDVELRVVVFAEQVEDVFVVDLEVGAADEETLCASLAVDAPEDVREGAGDDALLLLLRTATI